MQIPVSNPIVYVLHVTLSSFHFLVMQVTGLSTARTQYFVFSEYHFTICLRKRATVTSSFIFDYFTS